MTNDTLNSRRAGLVALTLLFAALATPAYAQHRAAVRGRGHDHVLTVRAINHNKRVCNHVNGCLPGCRWSEAYQRGYAKGLQEGRGAGALDGRTGRRFDLTPTLCIAERHEGWQSGYVTAYRIAYASAYRAAQRPHHLAPRRRGIRWSWRWR